MRVLDSTEPHCFSSIISSAVLDHLNEQKLDNTGTHTKKGVPALTKGRSSIWNLTGKKTKLPYHKK